MIRSAVMEIPSSRPRPIANLARMYTGDVLGFRVNIKLAYKVRMKYSSRLLECLSWFLPIRSKDALGPSNPWEMFEQYPWHAASPRELSDINMFVASRPNISSSPNNLLCLSVYHLKTFFAFVVYHPPLRPRPTSLDRTSDKYRTAGLHNPVIRTETSHPTRA